MSILKEIKYAINSTIGTSYFKPLDEMLKPEKIIYKTSGGTIATIATDWSGKLKVKSHAQGEIWVWAYSKIPNEICTIKVNNTIIKEMSINRSDSGAFSASDYFSINEGDIIEIIAEGCYVDIRAYETIIWNNLKNI